MFERERKRVAPDPPVRAEPAQARRAQRRLAVGAAGDASEREAERVADDVLRSIDALRSGAPRGRGERSVRRSGQRGLHHDAAPEVGLEGGFVSDEVATRIQQAHGAGLPLDETTRSTMEPAFGVGFGNVRIHPDSPIPARISAAAFTVGSDVHIAPGLYRPAQPDGQHLLAHELTHVVQQGGAGASVPRTPSAPGVARAGRIRRSTVTADRSPTVRRKVRGSTIDPRTHVVATGHLRHELDAARGGASHSVPAPNRTRIETASGTDLSGVRVHDDAASWSLNGQLGTAAFATGRDVFFRRSAFQPGTASGRRVIDHELGHIAEQRRVPLASGAQALAIDDARVTAIAQREYMKQADILEQKLGPHLSKKPQVTAIADDMLGRLRMIVDAWAEATKTGKSKVYESEFAFPTGKKYYGSFKLTAKEIKRVFDDKGQPLRKKLNLIYYCVRNGNLNKYLEVAANELMETAKTGKPSPQKALVPEPEQKEPKEVTVKSGFAAKSGLKGTWDANTPVPMGKTSKEEVDTAVTKKRAQAVSSGEAPVLGANMFGGAFGGGSGTGSQLRGDKVYDTYAGLDLSDTLTLTRNDVDDITTAEMRLLYERMGRRQPAWLSHKDKEKFKRDTTAKILWEQGGENIEIKSDSETRRIADLTLSRLEGGISGSTDLMMHASKHLGYTDVNDLKKIRLALVAWMLSNRDHSFFEIMKVAADYGAPFHLDPANIGAEYENDDNFYPLSSAEVIAFKDLLPAKQMPAYYLTGAYTGQIDVALPGKGTTSDTTVEDLKVKGMVLDDSWKADPKADDLAQWLSLTGIVPGLGLVVGRTDDDLKKNRIAVQRLLKDRSWQHVVKASVDPNARKNLRALLAHQFGAAAVISDGDFTAIGLPPSLFETLDEYKRYDLYRLYEAVRAAAPGMKTAASTAHAEKKKGLRESLSYAAVSAWVGRGQVELILGALLQHTLTDTRASSSEKSAATTLPKYATFVQTYPDGNAQRARLATLGMPASWLDWIAKTYARSDPSIVYHHLDEVAAAVTAAGFRATEAPSSPANQAARLTVQNGAAFKKLSVAMDKLGPKYAPLFVKYFIEKAQGAKGLTADENAQTFEGLATPEKINELTAFGVPRDVAETADKATLMLVHDVHRAVVDAAFDSAKAATHKKNKKAWTDLRNGAAVTELVKVRSFARLAVPIAATMVRQIHTAVVLSKDVLTLAKGTDQRMANVDKVRLGKTQVVDTTTLATPSLSDEPASIDPVVVGAREQRYWATDDADADFKKNVEGKSPTVKAQLAAYRKTLMDDDIERAKVMTEIATEFVAKAPSPKPSVAEMETNLFDGMSKAEIVEAIISGYLPAEKILLKINPATKQAIDAIGALSPRERGALYQYTNKLHDELGYATQQFSMSDDFTTTDVSNVTEKLRSLKFMLPMVEALHSALEQLPAYTSSGVFSGRKSNLKGGGLTVLDDAKRLEYAAKSFTVGSVVSYSYPLSTAKDLDSSFIVLPGYDVCLSIEQPILTGRDIEYLSNKPNEKEVLFPQGVRFKVVRYQAQPPAEALKEPTKNKLWVVLKEI